MCPFSFKSSEEIPTLPRNVYMFWPELCIFCCQTPISRTRCSDICQHFRGQLLRVNLPVWAPCPCAVSWLTDLQSEPVFRGGIQIFPVLATTDPSLATVGVPALFWGVCPAFTGAGGGCECLYKSPLHSPQCCLKGCLVNRIIKLSCRQATEINGGPLGMSLIQFPAQPLLGCVARAAVMLKGGLELPPPCCSPKLLGPPGNKGKKGYKAIGKCPEKMVKGLVGP